jgi:hypothetical protein
VLHNLIAYAFANALLEGKFMNTKLFIEHFKSNIIITFGQELVVVINPHSGTITGRYVKQD